MSLTQRFSVGGEATEEKEMIRWHWGQRVPWTTRRTMLRKTPKVRSQLCTLISQNIYDPSTTKKTHISLHAHVSMLMQYKSLSRRSCNILTHISTQNLKFGTKGKINLHYLSKQCFTIYRPPKTKPLLSSVAQAWAARGDGAFPCSHTDNSQQCRFTADDGSIGQILSPLWWAGSTSTSQDPEYVCDCSNLCPHDFPEKHSSSICWWTLQRSFMEKKHLILRKPMWTNTPTHHKWVFIKLKGSSVSGRRDVAVATKIHQPVWINDKS